MFKEELYLNQNWTCFKPYENYQDFLSKLISILKQINWETQKWH